MRTSSPAASAATFATSASASAALPVRLGLAAAMTSLIAGCSVTGSSAGSPSAAPSAVATATAAALSGTRLASVLLPASSMPKGYTADQSATRDTGSELPSDNPSPLPAGQVCQAFEQTSYIRAAGINDSDFAESDFVNASQSEEIAEEIDIFTGSDAQRAMTALWQEFGECASFSYQSNGTTTKVTLTRSSLPGQGDDAIKAVLVSPLFQGGETLVAIRLGAQVITTLDSSSGNDLGSAAVGYAEQIAQRLRGATAS